MRVGFLIDSLEFSSEIWFFFEVDSTAYSMVIGKGNNKRNYVFFWPCDAKGRSFSYIMFQAAKPHSFRFGNTHVLILRPVQALNPFRRLNKWFAEAPLHVKAVISSAYKLSLISMPLTSRPLICCVRKRHISIIYIFKFIEHLKTIFLS